MHAIISTINKPASPTPPSFHCHRLQPRWLDVLQAWYVVFQVEGNANFLVPSDLHPAPYFQFGYWPVRNLQMKVVRGGQRACTSATVGCGWEVGRGRASVAWSWQPPNANKAFSIYVVHSTTNVHPTNIVGASFVWSVSTRSSICCADTTTIIVIRCGCAHSWHARMHRCS